jgi:probable H4MPT-linked C1 transfer pathway protein
MTITAGYDVGGAHLKVALVENGRPIAVEQIACPLWLGLDRLDAALDAAGPLTARATRHAVTMTGELCEIFQSRAAGVVSLVEFVQHRLSPEPSIWMGMHGFGRAGEAVSHVTDVASTNFFATASLVAQRLAHALLIDMGSTTTDIIPIVDHKPSSALTDADRLTSGELVYTGLTRTAVSAVTRNAPFAGRLQAIAADAFANMADVRRILDVLPEEVDQHETADGRGKSQAESLARFARGFGRDIDGTDAAAWQPSAAYVAEQQVRAIHDAATVVTSRVPASADQPVIAAGIGARVVAEVARRLGRQCMTFGEFVGADDACRMWATRCAPAVAVAILADQR